MRISDYSNLTLFIAVIGGFLSLAFVVFTISAQVGLASPFISSSSSDFSGLYTVGDYNVGGGGTGDCTTRGDVNADCMVNSVDGIAG